MKMAREKGSWFRGKGNTRAGSEVEDLGSKWDGRYNVIQMTHIKFITRHREQHNEIQ